MYCDWSKVCEPTVANCCCCIPRFVLGIGDGMRAGMRDEHGLQRMRRSMRRCDHLRHNEPGEELQTNANSVDVRLQRGLRDGRRRMYCRFRMWMSRPWRFVPNVLRYSLVGQTFQYLPRSLTLRFETSRTVIHRCYCYLVLSARSVLVYIGFRTARFCLISRDGFE